MGKYVEIIWCGKSILCDYVGTKKVYMWLCGKKYISEVKYIYVVKVKMWINVVSW